ncbi:MAG: ABC transporter permease [Alicyclobacillaceae bacterium]|nr:ABC transporter permease [Alicyclobacillaceae bacterium]
MIDPGLWKEIGQAGLDTVYMILVSVLFSVAIGGPVGVLLIITSPGHLKPLPWVYRILGSIVNILRSVPFIILLILMIPLTRLLVGTSIGVNAAIPPLVASAAPFFARLVETSLREVDRGVIEAAQAMGARTWQIIWKVLLPEARPGLLAGITITAVSLIGYSAMAGAIGGGGLGDLAVRYGYQRFDTGVMLVTTALLVVFVQLLQWAGDRLVLHFTRR